MAMVLEASGTDKFGKSESDGQGLRIAIEKAIEFDIPVLTAVRDDYIGLWRELNACLPQVRAGHLDDLCQQTNPLH